MDSDIDQAANTSEIPHAARRYARVPKASDILADRLRAKILGRAMRPGDQLASEAELITRQPLAADAASEHSRRFPPST